MQIANQVTEKKKKTDQYKALLCLVITEYEKTIDAVLTKRCCMQFNTRVKESLLRTVLEDTHKYEIVTLNCVQVVEQLQ